MRIGSGVALVVIGAILAFAVNVTPAGIDLQTVGYILMAAGVFLLVVTLVVAFRGRSRSRTTETTVDPATGRQVQRTEYRDEV